MLLNQGADVLDVLGHLLAERLAVLLEVPAQLLEILAELNSERLDVVAEIVGEIRQISAELFDQRLAVLVEIAAHNLQILARLINEGLAVLDDVLPRVLEVAAELLAERLEDGWVVHLFHNGTVRTEDYELLVGGNQQRDTLELLQRFDGDVENSLLALEESLRAENCVLGDSKADHQGLTLLAFLVDQLNLENSNSGLVQVEFSFRVTNFSLGELDLGFLNFEDFDGVLLWWNRFGILHFVLCHRMPNLSSSYRNLGLSDLCFSKLKLCLCHFQFLLWTLGGLLCDIDRPLQLRSLLLSFEQLSFNTRQLFGNVLLRFAHCGCGAEDGWCLQNSTTGFFLQVKISGRAASAGLGSASVLSFMRYESVAA